jgi:tight adherence protein B
MMLAASAAAMAAFLLFPMTASPRHPSTAWSGLVRRVTNTRTRSRPAVRRLRDREVQRVVDFTLALAAELRAGQAPPTAWDRLWWASPLGGGDARADADIPTILRTAGAARGRGGLIRVAACWEVAEHSGAGLAEALERVARGLQAEREVAAEIEGQLAGSRATARLLVVLPVLALVMGETLGADPLHVLFTTPYGWGCLLVGGGLSVVGSRWVEHQVRSVTPWPDR